MRTWLLVSVLFAASCSFAKANPEFCERNDQCLTTGSFCDPLRHRCTQPPAELQLTAVEPPTGLASGGTSITLRGQNFKSGMSVLINGVPTGATFVSAAGDSATTVAPFSNGVCGPVRVRVTNLDGESVENAAAFRYRFGNVNFTPSASTTIYTAAAAVGLVAVSTSGSNWNDLVALSSAAPSSLKIMQVGPTGQFGNSSAYSATATYAQLFAANLNSDDYSDLITLRSTGAGAASLWLGAAGSSFSESLILNSTYKSAATIDLNQDGLEDLVLNGQTNLGVYRNSSAAGVAAFSQVTGNQPNGAGNFLAVNRFDADMIGDVAVADAMGMLAVSFGNGNFGFATTVNPPSGLGSAGFMTSADIDQDGRPDIVMADPFSRTLSIIRNLGNRAFAAPMTSILNSQPDFLQVADVDCDGFPDIVYVQRGTRLVNIQRNQGIAPYFDTVQKVSFTAPDNIALLITARLDQDNLTDLAMVGTTPMQNMAYILRNISQ